MATVTNSDLLVQLGSKQYPMTLENVRQENPLASFGTELSEEDLATLGYALVHDSQAPTGDVVTETTPTEQDGVWTRAWVAREFNAQEKEERFDITRNEYIGKLEAAVNSALAVGMPYDVEGTTYHVQLREKDKTNLLGLAYKANKLVAAGAGDNEMIFRPYENVSVSIPATAMATLCDTALATVEELYAKVWAIKDKADAAVYGDTLDPIPENFFE